MTALHIHVPPRSRRFGLVSAEILKLRKRRSLVAATVGLVIVPVVTAYAAQVILHASNPATHGAAGGKDNFDFTVGHLVPALAMIAAIVVGVTAGTGDLRAGIFRELVVTGRSRLSLYAARVPAGLTLLVPVGTAAVALSAVAATTLAGPKPQPPLADVLHSIGWIAVVIGSAYALSLGVASLLGSTGASIAALVAWQLALSPLLVSIEDLGAVRVFLPGVALIHFAPPALDVGTANLSISTADAVAATLLWAVLPLTLGAWRTATRDA